MFNVHHVIANGQIAKVGEECGGLGFLRLGARLHVGFVGEIVRAEHDRLASGKLTPAAIWRAHNDGHAHVAGQVAGLFEFSPMRDGAAAKPIRYLVLAQHGRHAFNIALRGHGENNALLGGHQVFELLDQRGNGAMKAQRWSRVHGDFAQSVVFFEHVDSAELVEVEAVVRLEQAARTSGRR